MITRIILIALILFSAQQGYGQRFFKPIPKPLAASESITANPVRDELRPIIEVSAYGFPGAILLTGAGFSYQHLKFKNDRWRVTYSVSYITWYDLKKVYSGITFGVLNNNILIGVAAHDKEIIGTIGFGVNFNN